MTRPLHVAFVWHMHQPYYKDLATGFYEMPWVRVHAIKDYYDMVAILEDYPNLHQTFNLMPSLMRQLDDYAQGEVKDRYLEISMKSAELLSPRDKIFILERFCDLAWLKRVSAYPRYLELIQKKA